MRFLVPALIAIFAGVTPASAQISSGVKGGVNYADVSFDGDEGVPSSGRAGWLAGVFATIPIGPFALQPELIYTVKGTFLDINTFEPDYIVDYLEVPVLARVQLGKRLYAAAGPSFAFRVRARNRISFGGSTEEIDIKDEVNSFDLGVVGAIGVEFGRWVVDGRYTYGLSDSDADTSDAVKIRNRVVSLSAGFKF